MICVFRDLYIQISSSTDATPLLATVMWGSRSFPLVVTVIGWEQLNMSSCMLSASGTSSPELTVTTTSTSFGIRFSPVRVTSVNYTSFNVELD